MERNVRSVEKALAILDCFTLATPKLGVSEIARRVGLDKSSVHRLLHTMARAGVVSQDPRTKRYRLGFKLLELAHIARAGLDLVSVALPLMEALRERINETISLWVRDGDQRICIAQVEGTRELRMHLMPGKHYPLPGGAAGKVLLSGLKPEERHTLLALLEMPASKRKALEESLQQVYERGFAVSHGEMVDGSVAVAAPVRDASGHTIAALSVAGPAHRFDAATVTEYAAAISQTAEEISSQLGYTPRRPGPRTADRGMPSC
ncbi:MAG TPA: IclR family transcriptional regulator [Chloroflexota bacterium]|nr:IclR family transcriptional regulator [Chloroflexota bacterium]